MVSIVVCVIKKNCSEMLLIVVIESVTQAQRLVSDLLTNITCCVFSDQLVSGCWCCKVIMVKKMYKVLQQTHPAIAFVEQDTNLSTNTHQPLKEQKSNCDANCKWRLFRFKVNSVRNNFNFVGESPFPVYCLASSWQVFADELVSHM